MPDSIHSDAALTGAASFPSAPTEVLSAVDAAWLQMDEPDNLMVISTLLTLNGRITRDQLLDRVTRGWLSFPRLRQRVFQSRFPGTPPYWVVDPDLDPSAHVTEHSLEGNPDVPEQAQPDLEALCGELISAPIDMSRPLWHMHLIHQAKRSAVILRAHHCLGDGRTMLHALSAFATGEPSTLGPSGPAVYRGGESDGLPSLGTRLAGGLRSVLHLLRRRGEKGSSLAMARMVGQSPDPVDTPLKGPLVRRKFVTWTPRPIPLDEIKAIGKRTQTTVNDVVTTAVTGALRRLLAEHGCDPVPAISAVVPVDLKTETERGAFTNKFGVVVLQLPCDLPDPPTRLRAVHERMSRLKASVDARASLNLLDTLGALPRSIQRNVLRLYATKASLVLTNVPGPRKSLFIGDQAIEGVFVWVPPPGRLALGISLFSYCGNVWMGFTCDSGRVPEPGKLVEAVYSEMDRLRKL